MKTNSHIALRLPSLAAGLILATVATTAATAAAAPSSDKEVPTDATSPQDEITATGTVFSVEPELISVVMKDNPRPVQFYYDKETPVVDEKGATVPLDLVRADLPLTVHYVMEGEKMVARRVVVSRSMVAGDTGTKPARKRLELAEEKSEETARAAEDEKTGPGELRGTLATIEQTVSIVTKGETSPTPCIINNSTRFVNIAGHPVSPRMLMTGMTLTIKVYHDGKRAIAQEIIIPENPAGSEDSSAVGSGTTAGASGETNGNSRQNSPNGFSQTTGNQRLSVGNQGFSDLLPVQGYVLPGQAQGQAGNGAGDPGNRLSPKYPNPNSNPGRAGNGTAKAPPANPAQPNTVQPNTVQPKTQQPNTPPAGETTGTGGGGSGGSSGGSSSPAPAK